MDSAQNPAKSAALPENFSLATTPLITKIATSAVANIVADEAEKNQIQSNSINKNLSIISSDSPAQQSRIGENECKEHIMLVLKLFAEDKICAENVWNLKLIDYMRPIFKHFGDQSLQIATTSLDASTKIYAIRVDDVHSEGIKLANSLARIAGFEDNQNHEEHDGLIEDGDQKQCWGTNQSKGNSNQIKSYDINQKDDGNKNKKKKLSRGVKHTIAKDVKSLVAHFPKLGSAFYQSKFDDNNYGITQLFTNALHMDYCRFTHLLDCEEPFNYGDTIVKQNEKRYFKVQPDKIEICSQLRGFTFEEWNPDDDIFISQNRFKKSVHNNPDVYDNPV